MDTSNTGGLIDLSSILSDSSVQDKILGSAKEAIQSGYHAIQALGNANQVIFGQQSQDAATIEQQQLKAQMQTEENSRVLANAYGTNVGSATDVLTGLGGAINEHYAKANSILDSINETKSIDPFAHPLDYIVGQFQLPFKEAQFSGETQKVALLEDQALKINTLTQEGVRTQASIAQTQTVETVAAGTRIAANNFTLKANQAAMDAQAMNVQGVKQVTELSQQQLQNKQSVFQLGEQIQQRQLQQKSLELAQTEAEGRIKKDQQTETDNANTARDVQVGLVNLFGQKAPQVSVEKINAEIKNNTPLGKLYQRAQISGQYTQMYGSPIISNDPGEAATMFAVSNAPVLPGKKSVRDLLDNALIAAQGKKFLDGRKVDPTAEPDLKSPGVLQQITGINAMALAGNDAKVIDPANNANIYQAPGISTLTQNKAIQSDTFYKTVIKPQEAAGMTDTDPDKLFGLMVSSIKQGQVSYSDGVRGLALMFQNAIAINNQLKGYDQVGLPIQTGYNAKVKINGYSNSIVDLTDPVSISNALSKALVTQHNAFGN